MAFVKHYLLALLVFNLVACSSLQPVSIENAMHNSPPRGIDYGSLVEIKTLDKRKVKFRVTDINADGLGGNQGFFRYENMASLKVDSGSNNQANTVNYILGILGIAALIALVASADTIAICSTPPCINE